MDPKFKIILTLLVLAAMLVVFLVIPMFVIIKIENGGSRCLPKEPLSGYP